MPTHTNNAESESSGSVYNNNVSTKPYASWQHNEDRPERARENTVRATAVVSGGVGYKLLPVKHSVTLGVLSYCWQTVIVCNVDGTGMRARKSPVLLRLGLSVIFLWLSNKLKTLKTLKMFCWFLQTLLLFFECAQTHQASGRLIRTSDGETLVTRARIRWRYLDGRRPFLLCTSYNCFNHSE